MDNVQQRFDMDDIKFNDVKNFEKSSLELLANQLLEKGVLASNEEKEKLLKYYEQDNRELKDKFEEVKNLNREDALKKIRTEKDKKVDNKISLENITEFKNDETGKEYISIHSYYPVDELKVIENPTHESAKDLFEKFKNEDGLVTLDGFVNSMDVYKNSIEKDKNEVKMENITELCKRGEFRKLSSAQKEVVLGVVISIINELAGVSKEQKEKLKKEPVSNLVQMLDKDIYISPEENIVMICIPDNPSKDEAMTVTKNESTGEYMLTSLNNKGNKFINETSSNGNGMEQNESFEKQKQDLGISKTLKPSRNIKRPKDSKVTSA